MKTLIFNLRNSRYYRDPMLVDFDKHEAESIDRSYCGFDDIYIASEDIEVRYKDIKGNTIVKKADKGDIIVVFYVESFIKNPIIVVKNKEWKENILGRIKELEAEKVKNLVDAHYSNDQSCDGCCNVTR